MRANELDYILTTMLDSNKDVSDLNITVDKPLQVESSGQLVGVPINPPVEKLTPFNPAWPFGAPKLMLLFTPLTVPPAMLTVGLVTDGSCANRVW